MPNLRITELPVAETLTGSELVELVQDGGNVKATAQNIADLAGTGLKVAYGRINGFDGSLEPGSVGITSVSEASPTSVYTIDVTAAGFTVLPTCVVSPRSLLAGALPGLVIDAEALDTETVEVQVTYNDAQATDLDFNFFCIGV